MDKRLIVKNVADIAIAVGIGNFVTKALLANAPKTSKYHAAEIGGLAVGGLAAEQLKPITHAMIDDWFDGRDAKKIRVN